MIAFYKKKDDKRTNYDQQNIILNIDDRTTRTELKITITSTKFGIMNVK